MNQSLRKFNFLHRSVFKRVNGPLPKISVIVPSYNQGKFLEETILSVVNQCYPNLELIIIDGGSSDSSVKIIERYQSHIAYWVSEKDLGQAHAINKGIDRSTGSIIGWLNSDDIYLPGAFKKVLRAFEARSDAGVVYSDRVMIDEDSRVSGWTCNPPFRPDSGNFSVCSETAFWKRSAMGTIQFDESLQFAMDLDFFCRLYLKCRFYKLNDYLGAFRCYPDNKSSTISHIGKLEACRQWMSIFGKEPPTSNLKVSKSKMLSPMVRHPRIITIPYLSRRIGRFLCGTR